LKPARRYRRHKQKENAGDFGGLVQTALSLPFLTGNTTAACAGFVVKPIVQSANRSSAALHQGTGNGQRYLGDGFLFRLVIKPQRNKPARMTIATNLAKDA
jgi:hypothetical protein